VSQAHIEIANRRREELGTKMEALTPQKIVDALDQHIIGQADAKRAVAVALRNRWRRLQLEESFRHEITPKNILMIGPTGVGKTEIARRLAKLCGAPFIKVEATKFTEVGYVGRDVDSIIRDLIETAYKETREQEMLRVRQKAMDTAEERVLDILLPMPRRTSEMSAESVTAPDSSTRQTFRKKLREGELNDREIEVELSVMPSNVEIMGPPGMEEMTQQLQGLFQNMGNDRKRTRKMKIVDAMKALTDEEAANLLDEEELRIATVVSVEQNGIVFIDEFDKIVDGNSQHRGPSREGVQRDLLPLIEGCTVSTKYGMVKTDHILFIASGAFHLAKPSDLIPELQGRLPIRVELSALRSEDFVRILTEPHASLIKQYKALLGTERLSVSFTKDAIARIADIASTVNDRMENIGARRLHTILERLLEQLSFEASLTKEKKVSINVAYVDAQLSKLLADDDASHFIL